MEFQKLSVRSRKGTGKGSSRRMRREGTAPAVIYGGNIETTLIAVDPGALIKALAGPLRTNTVLELEMESPEKGKQSTFHVIVRDHQYHPVSREVYHVDFYALDLEKPISLKVPLNTVGRSLGEQIGGMVKITQHEVRVECLPAHIPSEIAIDVSELNINDSVATKDLTLPEGVTVLIPAETTLVSVMPPKADIEETAEGEGEATEGEGEGDTAASAEDKKE